MYQRIELMKTNELEKDVTGLIQKDTRKKKFKDRSLLIEHYSCQLRDEKISVGRFLSIMSNMDNKIAFEGHEFPELDLHEIPFENSDDLEQYKAIMNPNYMGDDRTPVILNADMPLTENVIVQKKKEKPVIQSV